MAFTEKKAVITVWAGKPRENSDNKSNTQREKRKRLSAGREEKTNKTTDEEKAKSNGSEQQRHAKLNAVQKLNYSQHFVPVQGGTGGWGLLCQGKSDHLSLTSEALSGQDIK